MINEVSNYYIDTVQHCVNGKNEFNESEFDTTVPLYSSVINFPLSSTAIDSKNPFAYLKSEEEAEKILQDFIVKITEQWYFPQLFNYMLWFQAEMDVSNISKIKLDSQWFLSLSHDSKKKVVLIQLIEKLY